MNPNHIGTNFDDFLKEEGITMNDRFKFRAINMQTKEITYIDSFYWFEENGVSEIDHNDTGSGSFAEYWITQCTGLKDKNGKLIYEGDILKQSSLPHKVVCEWFKDGFWVNGFINGAKRELRNMHNWYEVVGNIYENKELLNDR